MVKAFVDFDLKVLQPLIRILKSTRQAINSVIYYECDTLHKTGIVARGLPVSVMSMD